MKRTATETSSVWAESASAAEAEVASWTTVLELLRARSAAAPQRTIYRFVSDRGAVQDTVTYGELDRRARIVAARLQGSTPAGSRAILLYPPGVDFIAAFLGCLYAGVVAVPCYPPGLTRSGAVAARKITADCRARALLTMDAWSEEPELREAFVHESSESLQWIGTDTLDAAYASEWSEPDVRSDGLAFLQYTSGTTADPKGVMVSHGNLLANLESIQRGFSLRTSDHGVLWLPPYHDMGLIGGILGPLFCDFPVTLMAPATFLRRPLVWLQCISDLRATAAGGPNFAYEMCVRAARATKRELRLDLTSWEMAFTGAEMVQVDTMTKFIETFAPHGFRAKAIAPCYGMAEATLLCTVSPRMRGMAHKAVPRGAEGERTPARVSRLAGCGVAPKGTEIRIVDPDSLRPCPDGEVGEVWVAGASVAKGYWGRPELSKNVFEATLFDGTGPFLRTGDRGFVADGELYLAGRLKDLIIIRGRNYAAEDIEGSLGDAHPAVKSHRALAFSVDDDGVERLVVSVEYASKAGRLGATIDPELAKDIARSVRRRVLEDHGLFVDSVIVLRSGATPLTTSGKLRRRACRDAFVAGKLPALAVLRAEGDGEANRTELPT